MRVLAISGSLRAQSSNAALLRAAAAVAPPAVTFDFYEALGALPHFNPDLDEEGMTPPPPVAALRARCLAADAILVCSPEYAHGVPGALKNALDWLVSVPDLAGKPIALINASPSTGEHAQAQLVEVLTTMSFRIIDTVRLQFSRAALDPAGRPDAATTALLVQFVEKLVAAI